jgi:lipopolysaccharide biosynthesis glycosyltransferase
VLSAKVIDSYLLATTKKILILDTDCLFFKPLQELRQLAEQAHMPSVVSKDPNSCPYCLPLDKLNEYFSISMKPSINSGLCLIETDLIDLELVEKWLSTPEYPVNSYFAEQTIIAGLVSRSNMMMLSDEYDVGRLRNEASCKFIHYCGHYLSSTRLAMKRTGQAIILKQLQALKNS